MPYCSNCGIEVSESAKFCPECGTEITADISAPVAKSREESWEGGIRKCPSCGERLGSFIAACPSCGHELIDVDANESVQSLAFRLNALEAARQPTKKGPLKKPSDPVSDETDSQIINLIRTFPIPNSREDIAEFLILALSNIETESYALFSDGTNPAARKEKSDAWLAKCEQAISKAHLMLDDSAELRRFQSEYNKKISAIKAQKRKNTYIAVASVGGFFLMFLFFIFAMWLINALGLTPNQN